MKNKSDKKNIGKKNKKENKKKFIQNKPINLCDLVKGKYILKEIFSFLEIVTTLKIIKKNKSIQKKIKYINRYLFIKI